MDADDNVRKELAELQTNADNLTNESLNRTRNMVVLVDEAQVAGAATLIELDNQGEQIDRINEGMDQINQDVKHAEKNLTNLEKCCGLCICPWQKSEKFEKGESYKEAFGEKKDEKKRKVATNQPVSARQENADIQGRFVERVTGDAREDEMEENIVAVVGAIQNMKNMAQDIGNELQTQNDQIGEINRKAISNRERIGAANMQASRILKN